MHVGSWIFVSPNSTVLFIDLAVKLRMRLIAGDNFLRKITTDLLMLQYSIGEFMALHSLLASDVESIESRKRVKADLLSKFVT